MLRLSGKNPKYYYFQSFAEIPYLMGLFRQSGYRYLHISSHASAEGIGFTHDYVSYSDFSKIFQGHLYGRRLFLSACEIGNRNFTEAMCSENKEIRSIVAPSENINFDHAAAIWCAFYVSMFARSSEGMSGADIKSLLDSLTNLFPVNFFSASRSKSGTKLIYRDFKKRSDKE